MEPTDVNMFVSIDSVNKSCHSGSSQLKIPQKDDIVITESNFATVIKLSKNIIYSNYPESFLWFG